MKTKFLSPGTKILAMPALLGAMMLTYGCVVYPAEPVGAEVEVSDDPPAPIIEVTPVAPGPDFIWVGGEWAWHGSWVWERGHYVRPPHAGAVWVPHRYAVHNGKHIFVRGGWR